MIGYKTSFGEALCGDSLELIEKLENNSVDLVVTSPPFALLRQKEYGNENQEKYVDWLCEFAIKLLPKLKDTGSLVIDLGAAYTKGEPTYSLYQFRFLIKMVDEVGYYLAQPFYWYNINALPAPIEWVNKKKWRAKNSVNTVWWFSKTTRPKADIRKVLIPYSDRMKKLLEKPERFFNEGDVRPSGHTMRNSWTNDNGGAIPSNMLMFSNAGSHSQYLKYCKANKIKVHPARFPKELPEFFIKLCTDENDLVIDIFGGSNTTGKSCEDMRRKWKTFELNKEYLAASSFRFIENIDDSFNIYNDIINEKVVEIK